MRDRIEVDHRPGRSLREHVDALFDEGAEREREVAEDDETDRRDDDVGRRRDRGLHEAEEGVEVRQEEVPAEDSESREDPPGHPAPDLLLGRDRYVEFLHASFSFLQVMARSVAMVSPSSRSVAAIAAS